MRGVTLIELIVVVSIIGVGVSVSALSFAPLFDRNAHDASAWPGASAINSAAAVRLPADSELTQNHVLYLPDGRAVGGVDPIVGGLRARP